MPSIADASAELNDKTMTRKEQIKEYLLKIGNEEIMGIPFDVGFECGVEWADSHPHWISVDDELPPLEIVSESWGASDDVLVYTLSHDILVSRYELDKLTQEHYWVFSDHDYIVTHWMPLPAPPMKGDQGND